MQVRLQGKVILPCNIHLIPRKQIILIQSYYRMHSCKIKYQKRKKWARYRKCVIQELVDSEFTYLKDLELIIVKFFDPLQTILTDAQSKLLFRNLKQIYLLNKQFLFEISERFSNFTQHTCFGKIFDKYVQFFKIYFEYTSGFSIEVVSSLRKEIPKLNDFISELEEADIFKGGNLESYLIKPVQRLPKYVLLLKDLIKHTWQSHPDYESLQVSVNKFIEVNCKIDILMDNVLKNQMLFELQKQFFDSINVSIVESTRRYVQSETINVLVSKQQKSVIVYICNDMIILTQRNQNNLVKQHEKLYEYLYLNEKSYCKNKPETQYCKFLFTVSSQEQSITFICQDAEQKQKLLSLFESLINDIKTKYQKLEILQECEVQSIQVFAKGTELRKSLLQSYTVYVMFISAGSQNLTLLTRYSSLIKLENMIRKQFPDISIPHLSKNQWASNKKTQLIEARKIIIENFLEAVLNSPLIKQNPEQVLKYLELPPSFYEAIASSPDKSSVERESLRKTMKSSSFNTDDISLSETLKFVRNTNTIRQTMHHKSLKISNQTINIKIMFPDEFYIFLPISPELRVADLIEMAAEAIKLQSYEDFKFFLINDQEVRILDDEDCIPQIPLNKPSNESVMSKFTHLFKEREKTNTKLLLKKYLYLTPKQEKKDYQSDLVRLNLICHQAFDDIKNLRYQLTNSQYQMYSIYYLIIKYYENFRHIFTKQSLPINLVKQLIPDKVYKQVKEQTWVQEIYVAIGIVKQEIEQIIKQHDKNLQGIKKLEQQFQYITELIFMESLQQNPFYGLQNFNIEIPNASKEILQRQFKCQLDTYCTLGVKYDRFIIIHNMEKKLEIFLSDIVNLAPFPFYFQFQIKQIQDEKFIFKTSNGLEIQKLQELYSNISNNL
ncbi:unnamed protein product (macronuclear) [Paramecium tetraurelia]|uniref:DH domain-containing protein n=1 Tax=Paramecium tetraurelia TaxID=5888 RepID=A0C114_PARTE|nr:uncharacterized protein GSPATT00033957001 [Paramecium tetraurelia]CAK64481.1 unnamed protein product [Paramecium tetraurelia]|eukprot:XP_001431879.1 hypothetical protein (macronuclear) [Paramecium tetraurelia strain d4-2]